MNKKYRTNKREDLLLRCKDAIRIILLAGIVSEVNAIPAGILVNSDLSSNAFAELVAQDGSTTPVSGLPALGDLYGVSMNQLGASLVGGNAGTNGYAAIISPTGAVTPLTFTLPDGRIRSVAYNQNNRGLIGGDGNSGFVAMVMPDGTVTPTAGFPDVTANTWSIYSVAINCSNVGLIGGETSPDNSLQMYAAFVTPDGTVIPVSSPVLQTFGHIGSVAINRSGVGIIGGTDVLPAQGVAAFVKSDGTFVNLNPSGIEVLSCAINDAGIGLIGGIDTSNAYAAYATQAGVLTSVFTSPFSGAINSVALNASGVGLVGGINSGNLYAAFVQPNGSFIPISISGTGGEISSVAIADSGIGLIGGFTATPDPVAFAALAAPNGSVTILDASLMQRVRHVDVSDKVLCSSKNSNSSNSILQQATPDTIGPYYSAAFMQLTFGHTLEYYFINRADRNWNYTDASEVALLDWKYDGLTASLNNQYKTKSKQEENTKTAPKPKRDNTIWSAPFGSYVHIKENGKIPDYKNQIAGVLVAYDHMDTNYLVGGGLGYAFNYITYGRGLGHGKMQEEVAVFYGSYFSKHFNLLGALWGGYYQFWNTRRTMSLITSKGKTHGWLLEPEVIMVSPWAIDDEEHYLVEPLVGFRWVNSWEHGFTERGASGLNLRIRHQHYSILESEIGVRFYERLVYQWGHVCFNEKISYVNQTAFNNSIITGAFVAATSGFPLAVTSNKNENLAAFELMTTFNPKDKSYPYGGITMEVKANRTYQTYYANFFLGYEF